MKKILGIAAVGFIAVEAFLLNRAIDRNVALRVELDEMATAANKSMYISAYLATILATNGIQINEFDKRVLRDPPGLFGEDIPTMFERIIENPDLLEELLKVPKEGG